MRDIQFSILHLQLQKTSIVLFFQLYLADLCSLFYKLECDEFSYKKRVRYNTICRIQRIVAIEQKSRFHAHVIVKRFGSHSDDMISAKIALAWHDVNCVTPGNTKQYLINTHDNVIRSNDDVSAYITKDVAYEITRHNDVIDFNSSFIR